MKLINYLLYFLITFLFIFFSCVKNDKKNNTENITSEINDTSVSGSNINIETPSVNNTITLKSTDNDEQDKKTNNIQEISFFLIQKNIDQQIFPNDFRIGKLQDIINMEYASSKIYNVVSDFCNSLLENILKDSLIDDLKTDIIKNQISVFLDNNNTIESFRIGEIKFDNSISSSVSARFFSDYGSINGQVFLINKENNWYISGLQFNFNEFESGNTSGFKPEYYNMDVYGINP